VLHEAGLLDRDKRGVSVYHLGVAPLAAASASTLASH